VLTLTRLPRHARKTACAGGPRGGAVSYERGTPVLRPPPSHADASACTCILPGTTPRRAVCTAVLLFLPPSRSLSLARSLSKPDKRPPICSQIEERRGSSKLGSCELRWGEVARDAPRPCRPVASLGRMPSLERLCGVRPERNARLDTYRSIDGGA